MLANLNVNLLMEDKQFSKIVQFHTHEHIKVENVMQRINWDNYNDDPDLAENIGGPMRLISVDISEMDQSKLIKGCNEEAQT